METKVILENRKARFNYEILETFTAGIQLFGDEVVSLRSHSGSITEAYAYVSEGECFITNMYIKSPGNIMFRTIDETRTRKLLLNKKEIKYLQSKVEISGMTIVPLKLIKYKNLYKVILGLAKGKKNYDKRQTIKERDIKRDIDTKLKHF